LFTGGILDQLRGEGYAVLNIEVSLAETALQTVKRFYEMPLESRMRLRPNGRELLGYMPSEDEVAQARTLGLKADAFEDRRRRGYSSFDFSAWPQEFARSGVNCCQADPGVGVRELQDRIATKIYEIASRISTQLLREIDVECGATHLSPGDLSSPTCSITRLLHYDRAVHPVWSKDHTDYEFLALIICDGAGLEVEGPNNTWREVPSVEGACVVLPGDMFSFATGHRLPATRHRVRRGDALRQAYVHFQGLRYSAPITFPDGRLGCFGEHLCGMLIRGSPSLAEALERGDLAVAFPVPATNPFSSAPSG